MKEKKNAIELEDVCIHYSIMNHTSIRKTFLHKKKRNEVFEAVKHVTFSVREGDILGIIGKNGSGKSTLLKSIAGVFSPNCGTIDLKGHSVSLMSLGVGFKDLLSGRENIILSGMLLGFSEQEIEAVIHFAGLKAVGESVQKPWEYYENNIAGTLTLVDVMRKHNVKNIIFSSSATVYGNPAEIPITEACPKGECTNPYGWTKSMLEQILSDIQKADNEWNVILLRYFNPIGAHKSGTMGENPNGIPNNLMPYITQVAVGKLPQLGVFGDDYDTPDGTGVRDYIHVVDLAVGHVKALKKIEEKAGLKIYNLGTGTGYSVLDMVRNFEEANGVKIPYAIKPRRAGDIAACYADASLAKKELGWEARYGIREMCEDSWRWQKNNPNGYED